MMIIIIVLCHADSEVKFEKWEDSNEKKENKKKIHLELKGSSVLIQSSILPRIICMRHDFCLPEKEQKEELLVMMMNDDLFANDPSFPFILHLPAAFGPVVWLDNDRGFPFLIFPRGDTSGDQNPSPCHDESCKDMRRGFPWLALESSSVYRWS